MKEWGWFDFLSPFVEFEWILLLFLDWKMSCCGSMMKTQGLVPIRPWRSDLISDGLDWTRFGTVLVFCAESTFLIFCHRSDFVTDCWFLDFLWQKLILSDLFLVFFFGFGMNSALICAGIQRNSWYLEPDKEEKKMLCERWFHRKTARTGEKSRIRYYLVILRKQVKR